MARTTIADLLTAARERLDRVGADELPGAIAAGALLVDIRSDAQRAADGTAPDAIFHPRNVLEWRADPASGHDDPRLSADLSRRIILMCNEGYQSSLAAATLQDLGFLHATDLIGGFQSYKSAGLPVTRDQRGAAAPEPRDSVYKDVTVPDPELKPCPQVMPTSTRSALAPPSLARKTSRRR